MKYRVIELHGKPSGPWVVVANQDDGSQIWLRQYDSWDEAQKRVDTLMSVQLDRRRDP